MLRGQPIQAVTFDVGGTLLAPDPSVGAVYAAVAARHGAGRIDPALLEERFWQAWRDNQPFHHTRADWESLVDATFEGLVPSPPSRSFFGELYAEFGRAKSWRVFDDVLPTLESLAAQGLDLGIVSNWDERLRPLLRELRLDRYFNCLVISCEAGFAKPSPVIFEEALRQLGRPATAVLHVGDGLREDFAGATGAGLAALHLRRDAPPHDLQIQSLLDVLAWTSDLRVRTQSRDAQNFLSPDG
jgi:putative hydrolase of the HAD superfamily